MNVHGEMMMKKNISERNKKEREVGSGA